MSEKFFTGNIIPPEDEDKTPFNSIEEIIDLIPGKKLAKGYNIDYLDTWFENVNGVNSRESIQRIIEEKLNKVGALINEEEAESTSELSNMEPREIAGNRFAIISESKALNKKLHDCVNNFEEGVKDKYTLPLDNSWKEDLNDVAKMIKKLEGIFEEKNNDTVVEKQISELKKYQTYIRDIKGVFDEEIEPKYAA